MTRFFVSTALLIAATAAAPNRAAADYLTPANETQLEAWLGEGNLTFTNIFSSRAGDGQTGLDFHAAVDGKGRTITLVRISAVRDYSTGTFVESTDQIIGGYNPYSWDSSTGYRFTYLDAERTGFVFNLTTGLLLQQRLSTEFNPGGPDYGTLQTYNSYSYGPAFGGGHDLYVNGGAGALTGGYANQISYGFDAPKGAIGYTNVLGRPGASSFDVTGIEVYAIEAAPLSTPAPPGALLALSGIVSLGGFGWLRRCRLAQ